MPTLIAQTNQLQRDSCPTSFRSLFDDSIVVTNAVFEKELFLSRIPAAAQKQDFFFKKDGQNYLLGLLSNLQSTQYNVVGGRFESTLWEVQPSCLVIYDRQQNSPTNTLAVVASESVMRATVNLFLNLGVTELARDTLVWIKDQNRIAAQSTDGKNMVIDFEGGVEAPIKASIRNEQGDEYAYVRYSYSPEFCNGKIPNGFTRFHSGAPSEDVGKIFTIRIRKLEVSRGHIPLTDLDPQKAFHFKHVVYYSNDVIYWKKENQVGAPQRVLTAEEVTKHSFASVSQTRQGHAARILVVGFLGLSAIGAVVLLFKSKKQEKQ